MTESLLQDADLLNAAGILLHGYLLCCAFKAKKGLHIQTGCLFKASPVLILWVNLQKRMIYTHRNIGFKKGITT